MKKILTMLTILFLTACPGDGQVDSTTTVGSAGGHLTTGGFGGDNSAGGAEGGFGGFGGFGGADMCPEGLSACKENCFNSFFDCKEGCYQNNSCSDDLWECKEDCFSNKHDCKERCHELCDDEENSCSSDDD